MTDTKTLTTAEVTVTVTVDGVTESFTATASTEGSATSAARGLLFTVRDDASHWTYDLDKKARR